MKYALIELPDDFEKGCCQDCPLSYTEWFDDDGYSECHDICVFTYRYDECPLVIKEVTTASEIFSKMRSATKEEQESVRKYVESISKPTGVNFNDIYKGEES